MVRRCTGVGRRAGRLTVGWIVEQLGDHGSVSKSTSGLVPDSISTDGSGCSTPRRIGTAWGL